MPDFNIRGESENYPKDAIVTDPIMLFVQEVDLLLSTEPYSVLGEPKFSGSVEHLLWKTNVSAEQIQSILENKISEFCYHASMFEFKVEVSIMLGSKRDIGEINLNIDDPKTGNSKLISFIYK